MVTSFKELSDKSDGGFRLYMPTVVIDICECAYTYNLWHAMYTIEFETIICI